MENKSRLKVSGNVLANIFTGVVIALAYVLFQNFAAIKGFIGRIFQIISPITGGLAIAYLLNMIMAPLERRPLRGIKKHGLKRAVSLTLTLIIALLIVAGLLFAIIPQTIKSVELLIVSVQNFLNTSREPLEEFASQFEFGQEVVNTIYGSWADVLNFVKGWVVGALPTVLNSLKSIGNGLVNGFLSLIIGIYTLADKERLCRNARLVTRALSSETGYERALLVARRSHRIFSDFIGGKLLDSLLVGVVCFIFMLIFKWPFPALISVVIGVTNIIPTFGPFIGAIPSMLIIAIESPIQAVYFGIFILILQQLEGNILAPLILSDSTGLSAFWVMVAITVFGAMWGMTGMIIGVPIVAVIYVFASEFIWAKLKEKQVDTAAVSAEPPEQKKKPDKTTQGFKRFISRVFHGKEDLPSGDVPDRTTNATAPPDKTSADENTDK